jgi:membrane-associated protein
MLSLPAVANGLIPWLDPAAIIQAAGPWALLVVCLIVFAETALLVGFILPGDTLLIITGLLTFTGTMTASQAGILIPIWLVCLCIAVAAFTGGEVGYLIGHKAGPRIFERRESGFFSKDNVIRTNKFFDRFGPLIWGAGLTFAGFLLGFIPPIADFVTEYIDLILLFAVACAVVPTVFHYVKATLKARKARRLGTEPLDDSEAIADIFEEGHTGRVKDQ